MRFIHAADLHIDSPLKGLNRYEGAPVDRLRGATRQALVRLVDLAINERVDFVMIAGDLYDRDWQDFHTGLFVREQMVRLGRQGIKVFIVQGNHDAQGVISRQMPWPENVKVFSSKKAETVKMDDLQMAIHGNSFPDREVPEDLVPGYPDAVPGYFNIGMLHTSLTGVEGHDTYAPTTLANLRSKGYDYWALGHVHARQVVSEQPRVVYPGNLQGRHARETGPKGCELVSVQSGVMDASFIPLDVVRWHRLDVDLSPARHLDHVPKLVAQALQAATNGSPEALHAVRLNLVGESALHALEAKQPGTLAAAVQAAAQDISGADVWIEQVRVSLQSPIDRHLLAHGADAVGELVRWVNVLTDDKDALDQFCRPVLETVLDNLPQEVKLALAIDSGADDVPSLGNDVSLRALVKDAESTLLARLSAGEVQA
jgi:exonuclease SbcD